jgi:hypothetical protein
MDGKRFQAIASLSFVLTLILNPASQARAQSAPTSYPSMAPIDRYLTTDRDAEIGFARSAAPESISHEATVLVLGRHGYETAVEGKNGFVCVVERSWLKPFDDPEFWNPTVRLPLCLNPPAARTHLPLTVKTTELVLQKLSKNEIFDAIKKAYDRNELPLPEAGSMCFMMSKQQNFGPKYGNADPHLMFWFPQKDHLSWGAEFSDSPVDVHQYSPQPITEFAISVSKWSDGTPAR